MAIMEISIVPLGTETASVSKYLKAALKVLKQETHIKYQVTSMGTIIEADSIDRLLDIAKQMHNAVLNDAVRVLTTIKIDDRKDKKLSLEGKVKSVCK